MLSQQCQFASSRPSAVGSVVRSDTDCFFRAGRRRKPDWANRSHDIFRNMFDFAIAWSHRPEAAGYPYTGIFRFRRPLRRRPQRADNLGNLGAVPLLREHDDAVRGTAVRLFLLIGSKSGENRCLPWNEIKTNRLALTGTKSGPRHVLVGETARELQADLSKGHPASRSFR